MTASQTAFQDPAIAAAVRSGMEHIRRAFQAQIARGKTTGQFHTDVGAEVQATNLLLVFEGLLVLARSGTSDLMDSVDLSLASLRP